MKRYSDFKIILLLFITALIIEACDHGAEKPLSLVVSTDQITLESNSTTVSFGIESNTRWSIESSEPWLSIEPATGANAATIQITALENPSKERTALITVLGDGVESKTVSITQKPRLTLSVLPAQITLESNSSTVSFGIESNIRWSIESSEPWLSIESVTGVNSATIQITALANPSKHRIASITVRGDGVDSKLISIKQMGSVFEPYLAESEPVINEIKAFPLVSSLGTFIAERIAISKDMKEIYYCELDKYPPTISSIKYYKYDQNKWAGPFTLFENYMAPAFSKSSDDTLFFQKEGPHFTTFYSVRNNNTWSTPVKFENYNSIHYLVKMNQHRYYAASDPIATVGQHDWCSVNIIGSDTIIQSLGSPLNTSGNDLDFFISSDESFIITSHANSDLYISYKTETQTLTTPVSLGTGIANISGGKWGPYVTADNKFLFFTSGNSEANTKIYWTRIDQIIEDLRP